jgi:hypothetical protein
MPRWSTLSREEQKAGLDALIAAKFSKAVTTSRSLAVHVVGVRRGPAARPGGVSRAPTDERRAGFPPGVGNGMQITHSGDGPRARADSGSLQPTDPFYANASRTTGH